MIMARKTRRAYQWLPCVMRYLEITWPKFVSYDQIISNATLGGPKKDNSTLRRSSRVCPTKTSFTKSMRGDPRFEKVKVSVPAHNFSGRYRETMWRLKR